MRISGKTVWLFLALLVFPVTANAHILPGGYLRLQVEGQRLSGTWDLSLYSLAQTAGLENRPEGELQDFALDKLDIKADDAVCTLHVDKTNSNPDDSNVPQSM